VRVCQRHFSFLFFTDHSALGQVCYGSPIIERLWLLMGDFIQAECSSCHETNSVKALKGNIVSFDINVCRKIFSYLLVIATLLLCLWWGCENTTPKAILTGHKAEVSCLAVSAELGIVISGSQSNHICCSMLALGQALCGLQGCKNWPTPFPGRMSYKASKPVCRIS